MFWIISLGDFLVLVVVELELLLAALTATGAVPSNVATEAAVNKAVKIFLDFIDLTFLIF